MPRIRSDQLKLYLVTDPDSCGPRGVAPTVRAALRGGVTLVQLRDKQASTRTLLELARTLLEICADFEVPLIINDRVDVALAAGAHGVHVGAEDMPVAEVRRLLGPGAIVGVSVRSIEDALRAAQQGADYVAANGVWSTPTKTDFGAPLGLESLRELARGSELPVVAIGGVQLGNINTVSAAGCAGAAVVSAIMAASDPTQASQSLRAALDA